MNCDRVGELLSAYLRDELLPSTRAEVQAHLDHCPSCRADLDVDRLVFELPRVQPSVSLHNRIFSSPEFQEIVRAVRLQSSTMADDVLANGHETSPPVDDRISANSHHSRLVVLRAGGRTTREGSNGHHGPAHAAGRTFRRMDVQRLALRMAVAAAVLVLVLGSALVAKNLFYKQPAVVQTPPNYGDLAAPVTGPLAAGNRVVYLHDGRLWSAPENGAQPRSPLTDKQVQVAPGWSVAPAAGPDRTHHLAYIDLKTGTLHFIQTDDSNDLLVAQVAPKGANLPAFWKSAEGQAILAGLAWAPDARQLAFVADPDGAGAALWVVNADGSAARPVSDLATKGALPRLAAWASDSSMLAYALEDQNGAQSLWVYAFDAKQAQMVESQASPGGEAGDVVRGLYWTADTLNPTLTWSAGAPSGQISGLWSYRLNQTPHLARLTPAGASFSAVDYSVLAGGNGAWLVAQAGVGLRSIRADGSRADGLASGHVVVARWSPDGTSALYMIADRGAKTGSLWTWTPLLGQRRVADGVALTPQPIWSPDASHVLYVVNGQLFNAGVGGKGLRVAGASNLAALSWSPDGKRLAFASAKGVTVLNPDGSAPNQVDDASGVSKLVWTAVP